MTHLWARVQDLEDQCIYCSKGRVDEWTNEFIDDQKYLKAECECGKPQFLWFYLNGISLHTTWKEHWEFCFPKKIRDKRSAVWSRFERTVNREFRDIIL